MKQTLKLITIFLLTFTTSCISQNKLIELPIQDFEFESIFGNKNGKINDKVYCLLGQGFFRAPRSDNSDELLNNWLEEHPNAKLIPVSVLKSESNMTYCWIVDGTENLNIYLVKNGCYPGGTMQRPRTWKEMSRKEKKIYRKMEKPDIEILINDNLYDTFIEELKVAELYAKENKLGIWEEKKESLVHIDSTFGYKVDVPDWLSLKETGNDRVWGGTFPRIEKIENALMIQGFEKTKFKSFEHFKEIYITGNKFGEKTLYSENHNWYGHNKRDLHAIKNGVSCRVFTFYQNKIYHNQFVLIETKKAFLWIQFVATPDTYKLNLPKFTKFISGIEVLE